MPSTPAVRAPRLLRTRAQATARTAGSTTRLNRSSNRRAGSLPAHWCSLVWILSTRARAVAGSNVGAPIFTDGLLTFQLLHCELAAALGHVTGFPGLGLLRRLRPTTRRSADGAPSPPRPGRSGSGTTARWFPRSPLTVRRDRRPAIPRRPRHDYPAALRRGLRPGQPWTWPKFPRRPHVPTEVRTADRPRSTRFEPTFHFRGFHHWFLHSYACPSRLPGPGRLAVPTRPVVVGAALASLGTSRDRLPPASSGRCDGPKRKDSHLPAVMRRLVAHGIVAPELPPHLLREAREGQHVGAGGLEVLGHAGQLVGQAVQDAVELGVHGGGVGLVVDRVQQRPHPRPGGLRHGRHEIRRV